MTADLAAVAAANGFVVLAGLGVLRAVGVRPALVDLPWTLGVGYLLGAAAVGVAGSALLVLGLALSWWQLVLVCCGAFAAGLLRRDATRPSRGPALPGWGKILPAAALLTGAILAVDFAVQPIWADDAWSIWGAKARSIVALGGLDPAFLSSRSVLSPDYPLLVPVLELIPLRFGGSPSELIPLQLGLAFLALPFALVALLRERVPAVTLWAVALAMLLAPSLQIQAASAVADVTLAVFFALTGVAAWRWLESGERALLWLGGCFAAAAVATKVEGRVFLGLLFVAVGVAALRRRRAVKELALVAGAVLASSAPWSIWSHVHGLGNAYSEAGGVDSAALLDTVDRVPRASFAVAREVADPSSWIALVLVAGVAIVLALRRPEARDAAIVTASVTLASLAFLVLVYWTTPLDYEYHVATSVRRVVTAPVLFAAAMAPLLLSRPVERQTAAR